MPQARTESILLSVNSVNLLLQYKTHVFWCFWLTLAIWTWLLVEPSPVPESIYNLLSIHELLPFLAAKTLHAVGYACLTIALGVWIRPTRSVQTFAIALLMAHGLASEIIQTFVPNRTGLARDVIIDWFGIAWGVRISRAIWQPILGKKMIPGNEVNSE